MAFSRVNVNAHPKVHARQMHPQYIFTLWSHSIAGVDLVRFTNTSSSPPIYSFARLDIILQAEIKGARAVFETIDTERNGFITVKELQAALTQIDPDPERAKALFDDIDQVMKYAVAPITTLIASYILTLLCFPPPTPPRFFYLTLYTCSLLLLTTNTCAAAPTMFTHIFARAALRSRILPSQDHSGQIDYSEFLAATMQKRIYSDEVCSTHHTPPFRRFMLKSPPLPI